MSHISLYKRLLHRVFAFSRVAPVISLILLIAKSLLQGVSIMMLIPFLELAGVSTGGEPSAVAQHIETVFAKINVPFTLISALGVYVGLIALVAGINYLQKIHDSRLIQDFTEHLRNDIHKAFSEVDWSLVIQKGAAEIGNLFVTEIQRVGQAIQQSIRLIGHLMIVGVYIGVSFILSIPMSFLALIGMGILLLLQRPLNRTVYNTGSEGHSLFQTFHKSIHEHIAGFKDVKSVGKEASYHDQFTDITDSMRKAHHRFGVARAQSGLMFETLSVVLIAVFFYAALKFFHIQIAELLVLLYIFGRLNPQLRSLLGNYQRILNILPAFESMQNFYAECIKFKEVDTVGTSCAPGVWASIYFRNVSYSYPGHDELVLDEVSLTIQPNQLTVVFGPSGVGKSTIADLLLQLVKPTAGTIFIRDTDLSDISYSSWRSGVGYVQQEPFLFNRTIRKNLEWANPEAGESELWRSLEIAGASSFVADLPEQLGSRIGYRGISLSGGEAQRIALARAVVRKPRLLILDEATNKLDGETERAILQSLAGLTSNTTILVITHNEKIRHYADEVIEI